MASAPQAPRARPAWRQQAEGFWRWWSGQLAQMVPARFAAFGGAGRVPVVAVEGEEVVLVEPRPTAGAPARATVADAPGARAAMRAMLERAGEGRNRARLRLAQGEALVRRANMPAATEENLGQVLAFEMDRLTPFRAEEVYFDYQVTGRDAAAGTIAVLIALARRDLVDARVATLRSLGVVVEGVNPHGDAPTAGGALNLMPSEQRGERESPRDRNLKRALLALVALLLVAVLVYPAYVKRERIIALHPVEARAQSEAQATGRLAQELERLVADHNFLLARKHGQPPALAYVEEVTRLLPDNTWVQQLDLRTAGKARELQMQGETASSSKLIEILSQSTMLQNVSTRGTETRGSQPGTVRFAIAAETKGRPQPEPTPVAQLSTPIPPAAPAPPKAEPPPVSAPPKTEPPKAEAPKPPAAKVEPVPPKAPQPPPGKGAPGK